MHDTENNRADSDIRQKVAARGLDGRRLSQRGSGVRDASASSHQAHSDSYEADGTALPKDTRRAYNHGTATEEDYGSVDIPRVEQRQSPAKVNKGTQSPKQAKRKVSPKKKTSARNGKNSSRGDGGLDTTGATSVRGMSHEEKRRRQNLRDALKSLLSIVVIGLIVGGVFLLYDATIVDTINIAGSERYSSAQIISLAGIQKGDNILMYNTDDVKSAINAIPQLTVVSVKRSFPNQINIIVADHEVFAAVPAANGTYAFIDADGYVLSIGETESGGHMIVYGLTGTGLTANTHIDVESRNVRTVAVMKLIRAINDNGIADSVLSIDVSNSSYIKMGMGHDFTVILGDSSYAAENIVVAAKAYALLRSEYPNGGIINVFKDSTIIDFTPNVEDGTGNPTEMPTEASPSPTGSEEPGTPPPVTQPSVTDTPATDEPSTLEPETLEPETDAPEITDSPLETMPPETLDPTAEPTDEP